MRNTVLDPCSIFRVQTWNSAPIPAAAIEELLDVCWPTITGHVARGRADILCIGPADWLVLAPESDGAALGRRLGLAFEGSATRATDVSQALVRIQIKGAEVRDLLAKACSLDLHPPLFPLGRALRTRFVGMPVIVHCTGTATFELLVTRSYAEFLLSWLGDAQLEFETSVA
jgi:sarcosine oxidase, subunit gamma